MAWFAGDPDGQDAWSFHPAELTACTPASGWERASREPSRAGEHARRFGRGETIYDPWHYVPVLARKPGALRNGAPFRNWPLPAGLERVRHKLKGSDDGDRQMVKILAWQR